MFVLGIVTQIITSSIRSALYFQYDRDTLYVIHQVNHYTTLAMLAAFLTIIGISLQQAIKYRHYIAKAMMLD